MHYVYHPHHEPVVVPTEEYQTYLENGWYDSPAKFPKENEAGLSEVDPDVSDEVEAAPKKKGRPRKVKAEEAESSVAA